MVEVYGRVGRARVSLGPGGDVWAECCAYRGSGKLRITGTLPRDVAANGLDDKQRWHAHILKSLPRYILSYLGIAQDQPWFSLLPRGRRRYDLKFGMVTEYQPDNINSPAGSYKADLHVHFTSSQGFAVEAALVLALVELMLGVKARREVTTRATIAPSGSLVPDPANFDTARSEGAQFFVAPEHEAFGNDWSVPKKLPPGLEFRGFRNVRDFLFFAFNVATEAAGDSTTVAAAATTPPVAVPLPNATTITTGNTTTSTDTTTVNKN